MMRSLLTLMLALTLTASAPHCLAWGRDGHRIVGELAQAKLNPKAQAAVTELLKGEPDPTLAGVASWADEVRYNDKSYAWTGPMHYVNFDKGNCHYAPPICKDDVCVVAAINRYSSELIDPQLPPQQRLEALKYVVHFVGDVHQPLHAGYAYDKGGNDYQISYLGAGWNLHSVWDSLLIESMKLTWNHYRQRLESIALSDSAQAELTQSSSREWAEASCRIVQSPDFYPPRHKINHDYLDSKRPLVDERLKLAGDRLADLLNRLLGEARGD